MNVFIQFKLRRRLAFEWLFFICAMIFSVAVAITIASIFYQLDQANHPPAVFRWPDFTFYPFVIACVYFLRSVRWAIHTLKKPKGTM